jgi:hypothetical protein
MDRLFGRSKPKAPAPTITDVMANTDGVSVFHLLVVVVVVVVVLCAMDRSLSD